jgi:lipopolysaccharide/colanic/teichoic acid biosynthesis glycosyltransferase
VREELLAIPEASMSIEAHPAAVDLAVEPEVVLRAPGAAVLTLPVVGRPEALAVAERAMHTAEETMAHAAGTVEHVLVVAVRRSIEVAVALVGLLLLVVMLPVLALAIKLDSPGPVIFRQTRLSKGGRPFTILKLRSMSRDAERRLADVMAMNIMDGPTFKAPDDPRVTRVGRVLRRFSLDELPQFWNVLRGEMALVGPRPPLPEEWALHGDEERIRLAVTPGITGLWQVSGRSHCPHQRMVELDLEYVRRRSLWLDLSIILRTVPSMFRGWGAY